MKVDRVDETESSATWVLDKLGEGPLGLLEALEADTLIRAVLESVDVPAESRRRCLGVGDIVWLTVAMAVLRHASIRQVTELLGLRGDRGTPLAPSSIAEARQRVGDEPVKAVFETLGMHWGHEAAAADRWCGLSSYSMDGTTMNVPDSDKNFETYGKPFSRDGDAGYPKVRLVALMATRSRILVDANFGPYTGKGTGETTLAAGFWSGIPDHSVLLFDRLFFDTGRVASFLSEGTERHFVTRESKNLSYQVIKELRGGEQIIEIPLSAAARAANPDHPGVIRARRIPYQFDDHPESALITSLLDTKRYRTADILDLYHERWSIELVYRDIKTTQLLQMESLRSRTPTGVAQEIWGALTAYQLIRRRMFMVASERGLPVDRMSFKTSLIALQAFLIFMSSPLRSTRVLRMGLDALDDAIENGAMSPTKRSRASYPRHVKVKMSSYARNRGRRSPGTS